MKIEIKEDVPSLTVRDVKGGQLYICENQLRFCVATDPGVHKYIVMHEQPGDHHGFVKVVNADNRWARDFDDKVQIVKRFTVNV